MFFFSFQTRTQSKGLEKHQMTFFLWPLYFGVLSSNISLTRASVLSVSKHEKTDESSSPKAECFYCFRVFANPDETRSPSSGNSFSKGPYLLTIDKKQKDRVNSQFWFSFVSLSHVHSC